MHKPIQMPRGLLDLLAHIVIDFHIKHIRHEIQSVLVILNFRIKASQVEAVRQIILVDFAEVLVAAGGDELSYHIQSAIALGGEVFFKARGGFMCRVEGGKEPICASGRLVPGGRWCAVSSLKSSRRLRNQNQARCSLCAACGLRTGIRCRYWCRHIPFWIWDLLLSGVGRFDRPWLMMGGYSMQDS